VLVKQFSFLLNLSFITTIVLVVYFFLLIVYFFLNLSLSLIILLNNLNLLDMSLKIFNSLFENRYFLILALNILLAQILFLFQFFHFFVQVIFLRLQLFQPIFQHDFFLDFTFIEDFVLLKED
jgi:hypothetical protein